MTMDDHGHLGLELGDLYFMCGAMSEKQRGLESSVAHSDAMDLGDAHLDSETW